MAFVYLTPAAGYSGGVYSSLSSYTGPITFTASNPAPAGSLITIGLFLYNSDTTITTTITDNAVGSPNTYSLIQSAQTRGYATLRVFRCFNVRGGPTVWTLTITGTNAGVTANPSFNVDVFTGGLTSSDPLDGSSINGQLAGGSGTDNIVSGSFTTTANGDLLVSYIRQSNGSGSSATSGTGFTLGQDPNTDVSGIGMEYKLTVPSGSQQATWNQGGTYDDLTAAMAFMPLATAVERQRRPLSRLQARHRFRQPVRHLYPVVHPFRVLEAPVFARSRAQLGISRKRRRAWHVRPHSTYPILSSTIPLYYQGVDFRQTLGFVTDPTNYDYALWGPTPTYPQVTRQGWTVGFTTTSTIVAANNESTSNDPRLAGNVYVPSQFLQLEGGGFIQLEGGGFISLEGH